MENGPYLKMYFLLKIGIFHCYVSLPEGSNQLVSWFIAYIQDLQPTYITYIGVFIHLLSTMDIPVGYWYMMKLHVSKALTSRRSGRRVGVSVLFFFVADTWVTQMSSDQNSGYWLYYLTWPMAKL